MNSSTVWKFSGGYLIRSAPLHLIWEIVQLPLYTLWKEPDKGAIASAIAHCTLGDLLIATFALLLGLGAIRLVRLPGREYQLMTWVTLFCGMSYTIGSEWVNTVVLKSWAYSELMPQVLGIGVSPILQWVVIPSVVLGALKSKSKAMF